MKIVRPVTINDATLSSSNVPEEGTAAAWSGATTYAVGDEKYRASTHRVYRSLQATNLNHTPETSPTWWQDIRATDRYKMFDQKAISQTTKADSIIVSLLPGQRIDSVGLLNVDASTVRVTAVDAIDGTVFDTTYNMVSDSGIQEWYLYFFEPIVRTHKVFATGIPPYANLTLTVTMNDTGATVGCGECIVGLSRSLGGTQYGARVGIRDFSVKEQDEFGDFDILERTFSKRGTYSLWVDAGFDEQLHTILETYRATALLWIGADDRPVTHIFGFYIDFESELALATRSYCSLEIEGIA